MVPGVAQAQQFLKKLKGMDYDVPSELERVPFPFSYLPVD